MTAHPTGTPSPYPIPPSQGSLLTQDPAGTQGNSLPLGVPPATRKDRVVKPPRAATLRGIVATGSGKLRSRFRQIMAKVRKLWAVIVRFCEPVLAVISPLGYLALVIGVAGLAVGYNYGWVELVAVGWAILAVLVFCIVFILGRSSYEIELDLARLRVVVGERAVGQVVVRNSSTRTMAASRIELPVGAGIATFDIPRMEPGVAEEFLFVIPTQRRCVIQVGPVTSVRGDPLGLLRRTVQWTEVTDLYVHPRTIRVDAASTGLIRDIEGLPTRDLSVSDLSFHALREYAPGDDRRTVHWKTSARIGKLMVRQFEESRRSNLLVLLPTGQADYGSPEEFEMAISAAGSFALQAFREDRDMEIVVSEGSLRTPTAPRFLDQLSALEARAKALDLKRLAAKAGATIVDASIAVLICGSKTTPTELRTASSRLPIGVVALAIQCAPEAEAGRAKIAEMDVLTIRQLDDLPRALRTVTT